MTNKIEVPRELLEDMLNPCADFATHDKLRSLLDAPEAPRQAEPVAAFEVVHGPMGDDGAPIWVRLKDLQDFDIENLASGTILYLSAPSPLSPDHSGGAGVVLPEYRIVNEGDSDADQNSDHGWNAALDKVKELNQ